MQTSPRPVPEVGRDRIETAAALWDKVLATGFVDTDPAERSLDAISFLLPEILQFLSDEKVRHDDRPHLIRSFNTLLWVLGDLNQARKEETAKLCILWGAYASSEHKDLDWSSLFSDLAALIDVTGRGPCVGTGPYSSVYGALLAWVADEVSVCRHLDRLAYLLNDPTVAGAIRVPYAKPGQLHRLHYFRGQTRDLPPIPKKMRPNTFPAGFWKSLPHQARLGFAMARFKKALLEVEPSEQRKRELTDQMEAIQQHYGFATELLDFSESIEVAAFFATWEAQPGEAGVIFRYHLAHPYVLELRSRVPLAAVKRPEGYRDIGQLGMESLQYLTIVFPAGVPRLERQKGVFIKGAGILDAMKGYWAAKAIFQPMLFLQHEGVVYSRRERNICKDYLMPAEDPIERIAQPIREKLKTRQ